MRRKANETSGTAVSTSIDAALAAEVAAEARKRQITIAAFIRETLYETVPSITAVPTKRQLWRQPHLRGQRRVCVSSDLGAPLMDAVRAAAEERGVTPGVFVVTALAGRMQHLRCKEKARVKRFGGAQRRRGWSLVPSTSSGQAELGAGSSMEPPTEKPALSSAEAAA